MKKSKIEKRKRRHGRIRAKIFGTATHPRLVVFRSLRQNYAQLIDDSSRKTIAAASDGRNKKSAGSAPKKTAKRERAREVGLVLAKLALTKGITSCVFDRNGYKYHGRVKALADGAREGGLKF